MESIGFVSILYGPRFRMRHFPAPKPNNGRPAKKTSPGTTFTWQSGQGCDDETEIQDGPAPTLLVYNLSPNRPVTISAEATKISNPDFI